MDKNIKTEIKSLLDSRFYKVTENLTKKYKLNVNQVFPLNKPGNFGRVLERKCRLVDRGIMEY